MTARRRSRRWRPLHEWSQRSWIHAIAAWLVRTALLATLLHVGYLILLNVLVPNMIDSLVEQFSR